MAILGPLSVMSFAVGAPDASAAAAAVWANALLDQILSPKPREVRIRTEGEPSYDYQKDALIALGDIGWEETFKRLADGRIHGALVEVLTWRSLRSNEPEKTQKVLKLLEGNDFRGRKRIPQIIAKLEPVDANKMLLPFLADSDPEVREACFVSLSCSNAASPEIETAIRLLDDPSEGVRFRAITFLERSTGHIPVGNDLPNDMKAVWSKWWNEQKSRGVEPILKSELTQCANLLKNPDEQIRERAGLTLIAHSGQTFFGFHQKNVWWGVHNGDHSAECWQEWLKLRYAGKEHMEATIWENEFHMLHPEIPLDVLRATISMNVKDLRSQISSVRSIARESIASILGKSCPFHMGYDRVGSSYREDDWLNEGIERWWEQRMRAIQ